MKPHVHIWVLRKRDGETVCRYCGSERGKEKAA